MSTGRAPRARASTACRRDVARKRCDSSTTMPSNDRSDRAPAAQRSWLAKAQHTPARVRSLLPCRAERRGMHDERPPPIPRHREGDVRLAGADVVGQQASALAPKLRAHAPRGLDLIGAEHDGAERRRRVDPRARRSARRSARACRVEPRRARSRARIGRHAPMLHASSGATSACFSRYADRPRRAARASLGGLLHDRALGDRREDRSRARPIVRQRAGARPSSARYRCQPPRAGSAIASSHAAASARVEQRRDGERVVGILGRRARSSC